MVAEGHQIASHTWSHPDLVTIDQATVKSEMDKLNNALKNILGLAPTHMRPPFG